MTTDRAFFSKITDKSDFRGYRSHENRDAFVVIVDGFNQNIDAGHYTITVTPDFELETGRAECGNVVVSNHVNGEIVKTETMCKDEVMQVPEEVWK